MAKNEQLLKDILQEVVSQPALRDKYILISIKEAWNKIFSQTIHQYTSDIKFKRGVLTVVVTSAPLRHELTMGKDKIIKLINEELGTEHVSGLHIY